MAPRNPRYLRPLSVAVDEAGTNYSIFTKELYRAMRNAILELRAHSSSQKDADHNIGQFKRAHRRRDTA